MRRPLLILLLLSACAALRAQPIVAFNGENERLRSASVLPSGNAWSIDLVMDDDNGNFSLPSSFRRWWHCRFLNLSSSGETLQIAVRNAGYGDRILPVWALSSDGGSSFGPFQRVPVSATPVVVGSTHTFTLHTPSGVDAIRLAKWFPYTVTDKNAFIARVGGHPHVRSIASLGSSARGRPIEMLEITDGAVPDSGKRRVWIHAGIHPAENTSYFTVEGLVDWLLSGEPLAEVLLDALIVDIVPMANPDGVFLGNYRTNSRSVNLEAEWTRPYNSPEPEIIALRTRIEQLMGTAAAPGSNPIEVLLNLHSSHNVSFPFHFQHTANSGWNLFNNPGGVLPSVNALEGNWIRWYRARSAFVALGTTMSSSCGSPTRPFVECMMHDRWSSDSAWTSGGGAQVMAITFEGTYGRGPDGVTWNTPGDYRQAGVEMGRALADYFNLRANIALTAYGTPCNGLQLTGSASPVGPGGAMVPLTLLGAQPNAFGLLVLGFRRTMTPLTPFPCNLLTNVVVTAPASINFLGIGIVNLNVPPIAGLLANFQGVTLDPATVTIATSNGLELRTNF